MLFSAQESILLDLFSCAKTSVINCAFHDTLDTIEDITQRECHQYCKTALRLNCQSSLYHSGKKYCQLLALNTTNFVETCKKIGSSKTCEGAHPQCVILFSLRNFLLHFKILFSSTETYFLHFSLEFHQQQMQIHRQKY